MGLWLLFGVDGGHVGGGFGMGRHEASLFPMPDEILDVLYRTHDERIEVGKTNNFMSQGQVRAREQGRKNQQGVGRGVVRQSAGVRGVGSCVAPPQIRLGDVKEKEALRKEEPGKKRGR